MALSSGGDPVHRQTPGVTPGLTAAGRELFPRNYSWFAELLIQPKKPKIRGRPQITQISQMTEAEEFGCDHREEFVRNKNEDGKDPVSSFSNLRNL
jgi:hypothetical protein